MSDYIVTKISNATEQKPAVHEFTPLEKAIKEDGTEVIIRGKAQLINLAQVINQIKTLEAQLATLKSIKLEIESV